MVKLIATKSMTYGTRRLVAGDPFEARRRDARILIAIAKAKDDPGKPDIVEPKPAPAPPKAPAKAPPPAKSED